MLPVFIIEKINKKEPQQKRPTLHIEAPPSQERKDQQQQKESTRGVEIIDFTI